MSEINVSGEPTATFVGANPYNTYGLATQGFVWAAISSVSGDFVGGVKTVNRELPDKTGNINVTSIRSEDYSGEINEIRADLTVLSGNVEYKLITNVDYDKLKTYVENNFSTISSASGGWNNTETKVEETSGEWDGVYSSVNSASGSWDSVYSTVEESSGGWLNHVTLKNVPYGENETLTYYTSGISNPSNGDILVLKKVIIENDDSKFTYTAFSYDGSNWVPIAGNYDADGIYDAENVFFTKNLTSSYAIGNIVLDNGKAEIHSKGKNLKEVFDMIFLTDIVPSKTNPRITLSTTGMSSYESGTSFTPTYSITYNIGSYTYGPVSDAVATGYTVTFMGSSYDGDSGTLPMVTATDSMSSIDERQRIAAYASFSDDTVVPLTNLGNPYPEAKITAGDTETETSPYFTSYRQAFHGSLSVKGDTFDSSFVRSLEYKSGSYPTKGTTLTTPYGIGAIRAVFAYPAALGDAECIVDNNGFGANIIEAFTKITVQVNDASDGNPIDYVVYYKDAAIPNTIPNTYIMHI